MHPSHEHATSRGISWSTWRRAALVAAALATGACASAVVEGSSVGRTRIEAGNSAYDLETTQDRIATRHVVEAPVNVVWAELPGVFAAFGLKGDVIEQAGHVFGIPEYAAAPRQIAGQRMSRLFSCGSSATGAKADSYEIRLVAVTRLEGVEQGTLVNTVVGAVARPRGVSGRPIECTSTGLMERILVDSLQARVKS